MGSYLGAEMERVTSSHLNWINVGNVKSDTEHINNVGKNT